MENPFVVSGYVSPAFFCDRERETKQITSALRNGRSLVLISLRRLGKTSLLRHVMYQYKGSRSHRCFYLDLLPTTSLRDLTELFARTVVGKLESTPEKALGSVRTFFSKLSPAVSLDASGMPTVQFHLEQSKQAEQTLASIFEYIESSDKHVHIFFDEFQQIAEYDGDNVEAHLRTAMQKLSNMSCVFSGSKKHLLTQMFSHHDRPFYKSAEVMELNKISAKEYSFFIREAFRSAKRNISEDAIEYLLGFCHSHTYYVQLVCNRLFGSGTKNIGLAEAEFHCSTVLTENESVYYSYRNLLTSYQWQLLKAIGKEGAVEQPMSMTFITKHNLGTPSSVKTALHAMLEREMIYYEASLYRIYDVFFARWLERG